MDTINPTNQISELLDKLLSQMDNKYHTIVNEGFIFANEGHKNQKRKSGEPYITHPLQVAIYLSEINLAKTFWKELKA